MPKPEMPPEAQVAYDKALNAIEKSRKKGKQGIILRLNAQNLTSLPPEIGQLKDLKELDLHRNRLTELPPEIGQLKALVRLSAFHNPLTMLPREIGNLKKLESLSVSGSQIVTLPHEIGELKELTWLRLDGGQLTTIPAEIGELTALSELHLQNNQLVTLPETLRGLPKLERLFLHGNPGLKLPADVLGPTAEEVATKNATPASPKGILDFYFEKKAQGTRALNEVRLVFVGRGASGKTSLVQRLVLDTFDPAQGETPGIALSDWTMQGCAGEPVTAHVWDFAGQVVTHSMHRYFLSHRTVYVLVLTQREDSAGEDADYWLKLIQSYGTDKADGGEPPPVVVALNKSDEARVKVDRNFLQERYPFIVSFVETDCQSGRGIAELRERLCNLMDEPKVKLWVREDFPQNWWKVKQAVVWEQQTRPHLRYDQWRQLCDEAGEKDKDKQDQLSKLLHTLGVALNYADDPRLHDNTVLRPNWVTHHCYNLIRHAASHAGVLRCAEVANVLKTGKDGEHDPRMHAYLMRLMERFEAAYPLGEGDPPEKWLVPLGLPDDQPAGLAHFGQAAPEKAARLRYTYPSIPPGLVAQFIVRTHPLMEPKMQWASGTVLALYGARALVRAVSKTEIEITTLGDDVDARRDLAGLCRDEINVLNAQIAGLEVIERTEVVAEGERVWVKMATLEADELRGKKISGVETSVGTAGVEAKKELDEFGTEEGRLPEVSRDLFDHAEDLRSDYIDKMDGRLPKRRTKAKPVVFVSYSHSDERHLKRLNLHLTILKNLGLIHRVWHDRRIQPGMDWDKAIQVEIAKADVVIFLASTAALASGYINGVELSRALARYVYSQNVIVPIILEPCDWVDTFANSPSLKVLNEPLKRVPQGIPRDNKPINSFNPRSIGWHQVSEDLKSLLTELKAKLK